MELNQQEGIYEAENPEIVVSDIFSGKLPFKQALLNIRTRLLDLSSRNRLLNYKHPKGRSIQFVDNPNLNLVFARLVDGKSLYIKSIPDPPTSSYAVKRPDVKIHAQLLDIVTEVDIPASACQPATNRHTPKLQALYYPADLDKLCRKIASEARTVIEETGTNMLYIIFGFLEFYDREDSERPMLAPLLSVPITIEKGAIDPITRTYQYSIVYSGEDVHENQTLREKLSQDFLLQMPTYDEEDEPGSYFSKVEQAVEKKKRWKVRHQLTLGFLSFGKLAIWADLDPEKFPGLLSNGLLKEVFSGGSGPGASLFPEDYEIDNHPNGEPPIIYDADSSQHSAIIDVLSGKNMVINGPPGTGKSQTITNIIAAGLQAGKRILFVSEKLAALEVVRHRLNQAHLGHFCLELHSHKTQKKKMLLDIQERLDIRFSTPLQFQNKIATLQRHKKELNRYAELMGSQLENELDLTIYQVFWKTEKCRQIIGDMASAVQSLFFTKAPSWTYDDIEYRRGKLETLGKLFEIIERFDNSHPWWGFSPKHLAPGDDEAIGKIVTEASEIAQQLVTAVLQYQIRVNEESEPTFYSLEQLRTNLDTLPEPPECLCGELLPRIFNSQNSPAKKNTELLKNLVVKVGQARELVSEANESLLLDCELTFEEVDSIINIASKELKHGIFNLNLASLNKYVSASKSAYLNFANIVSNSNYSFLPIRVAILNNIDTKLSDLNPLILIEQPCKNIIEGASILNQEIVRLKKALEYVSNIAHRRGIDFDGSPSSIAMLTRPDGIDEIQPGINIDSEVITKAQKASESVLHDIPLNELIRCQRELVIIHDNVDRIINELNGYSQQLGIDFNSTKRAIDFVSVLAHVSSIAPLDLLDYRRPSLANPSIDELILMAEKAHVLEKTQHEELLKDFYLDALPSIENLKAAVRAFRGGDSIFNIFNGEWRSAKKLYLGISKHKAKCSASEYESYISNIIFWLEYRNLYVGNEECKEKLGLLFKGVDTDYSKIHRLTTWYKESHAKIIEYPGFLEKVDLSSIDARTLSQLAALNSRINELSQELNKYESAISILLPQLSSHIDHIFQKEGWRGVNQFVQLTERELKDIYEDLVRYVKPEVSPKRAFNVLNARLEIIAAKDRFDELKNGVDDIRKHVELLLPGISSISCERWGDYINKLVEIASCSAEFGEHIAEFGDRSSTPQSLLSFMTLKIALDDELINISDITQLNSASDWKTYLEIASRKIESSSEMVTPFNSAAEPDKILSEIIHGLRTKSKAAEIMNVLANDAVLTALLENHFQGIDTSIEVIANTASWGEKIIKNRVVRLSSLLPLLLDQDAEKNLDWAKEHLGIISELKLSVFQTLNRLSDYGNFVWADWNNFEKPVSREEVASTLSDRIDFATKNVSAVLPWSKYKSERNDCSHSGLEKFVLAIESQKVPPESVGSVFEYVAYRSIGRNIYKSFPELEGFSGSKHEKVRSDFAQLDKEIIGLTGKSFAYDIDRAKYVPEGVSGYKASERTEMHLLWNELGKQRRHIPIRQLIKRAGRAIQALKPCWMMGPMSVAQYLEQGIVDFDMIVMDEASQLRPEESLGAIARGRQLIVVGDPKQLPPMNFFDRLVDDGEEDENSDSPAVFAGSESILDICQQLFHPVRTLRWHYRSQHQSLIAFSNHHFYNGKLIVFPSCFDRNNRLGLRYRYVKNGVYMDRKNVPEAQRVVDAVIEHMMKYPEESLGVVTLNQTQRDLIEDLLDKKIRNIDEAQRYMSDWEEKGWSFFVKNLENVQGDERDVIFISTTFGKAPGTAKPRQNFGPISRPDGWRRLNVLFTRSRKKIELFTSMLPEDIVLDVKTPAGTRALREYLDYAKRGILTSTEVSGRDPDSDFEISVIEMLQNKGYEVVPQLGVAGFFIDLAVRNPDRPGEFLAAVECDGATYHSSSSARDRDRIRQDILESLGWKNRIWRIWSTDWFYSPRQESERLLAFLNERRTISNSEPQPEYDYEEVIENFEDEVPVEVTTEAFDSTDPTLSVSTEELFIEVGDQVTYCSLDKLDNKHTVMIVDTESNPKLNLINENSPLALALLNAAMGDEVELEIKGAPTRTLRVLKIQRQEKLFD